MRQTLLVLALFATGCATAVNRPTERIPVRSEPQGAVVSVDCGNAPLYGGTTPTVIEVPRTADQCGITIAKEGFAEEHIQLERQISRATAVNRVGGVLGGTFLAAVALVLTWDNSVVDADFVGNAYSGGEYLGSAAGNAIDRKMGGAYKWVPGEVVVKLQKSED
ncbi:MAG: hypothetical protein ACXVJT_12685 [Thermoanaerobaculia bacterium]